MICLYSSSLDRGRELRKTLKYDPQPHRPEVLQQVSPLAAACQPQAGTVYSGSMADRRAPYTWLLDTPLSPSARRSLLASAGGCSKTSQPRPLSSRGRNAATIAASANYAKFKMPCNGPAFFFRKQRERRSPNCFQRAKCHDAFMDEDLSKRIDVLQADLEIVIRFSTPNVVEHARHYVANEDAQSSFAGRPLVDPVFLEKCRDFVARHEGKKW
jgi:hypothetical protein